MKRKILGVLIALCTVCAFVGCDDPVSEKPSNNTDDPVSENPSENNDAIYKDSAFVGTWVCLNKLSSDDGSYITKYTYILTEEGNGTWTGLPIGSAVAAPRDRTVVWSLDSNGGAKLIETVKESASIPQSKTGTLSEDGLELTIGALIYEKISADASINYKDSGYVGKWLKHGIDIVNGKTYTWKDIYTFYETGEGHWKREALGEVYSEPSDRTVIWFPRLDGGAQLIETKEPTGSYEHIVSLEQDGAALSVGYPNYKKINENADTSYADTNFVGAWVSKNKKPWGGSNTNSLFITIFILNEDGTGIRREDVIPGNADGSIDEGVEPEEGAIAYVNWAPLSTGEVGLDYAYSWGNHRHERGTIAEDGLIFTLDDGREYIKQQ